VGGSRTAPTGFVRIHTVRDYDNAVYVVGHYDPFVKADVRVLFCQPQPTIRDFPPIGIRVHFAINNPPENVRPVFGANGHEIRAVSRVVVASQPDRPAVVSLATFQGDLFIGMCRPI
jgi:hypothetical protein